MPGKHSQKNNNKIFVEMSLIFVIKKNRQSQEQNIHSGEFYDILVLRITLDLKKRAKYQAKLNTRRIKYGLVYLING